MVVEEDATVVVVEGEDVTGLSMYVRDLILSIFLLGFRLLLLFSFNEDGLDVEDSSVSCFRERDVDDSVVVVVEISVRGSDRNGDAFSQLDFKSDAPASRSKSSSN
jgi:hypothetical protein